MKENLCRPGGVISTHFGWPPASRQDITKRWSGLQHVEREAEPNVSDTNDSVAEHRSM